MRVLFLLFYLLTFEVFSQGDTVFIRQNVDRYADTPVYKTDTLIFEAPSRRNILIGNTILTNTYNQQVAKGYGLYLSSIFVEGCTAEEPIDVDEVLAFEHSDTNWIIKTLVDANCCQDFLADIKIEDENTLNLVFYNYSTYCSCSCQFELTYKLDIMQSDELKKIKSIIINGEEHTRYQLN